MEDAKQVDLATTLGFNYNTNTIRAHTWIPPREPLDRGVTSWQFYYHHEDGWEVTISFDSAHNAAQALARFMEDGYTIIEEG